MSCTLEIMDASETTHVCGTPPIHPEEKPIIVCDSSSEVTDPSDGITEPSDATTEPSDETTYPSDEANSSCDELPTHPMHKGIWFDPAEFVWAIGDKGRKMLIAGFVSLKYFPSEIATVFHSGPYHVKLSAQFGVTFACNAHDVVNAYIYMVKKKNVDWVQKFSEDKREEWEGDVEMRAELQAWVDELRKSMYNPVMSDLFEVFQQIYARERNKSLDQMFLLRRYSYNKPYTDGNIGYTHRYGPQILLRHYYWALFRYCP